MKFLFSPAFWSTRRVFADAHLEEKRHNQSFNLSLKVLTLSFFIEKSLIYLQFNRMRAS